MKRKLFSVRIFFLLPVVFLTSALAGAQEPVAVGDDFQINTYTTDSQERNAIAMDDSGNFFVVWRDSSTEDLRGALFHSDGSPFGTEFQINETAGDHAQPAIARSSTNFMVVWPELDGEVMQGRIFQSDGSTAGSTFEIGFDAYANIAISVAPSDEFIVVWDNTANSNDIRARRIAGDGSALGAEILVNSYTTGNQLVPSVAVLNEDGDFVVVWTTFIGENGDPDGSIQGRRFTSDGFFLGDQFLVNEITSGVQLQPDVAADSAGDFIVVWSDTGIPSDVQGGVQGRRFASDASPLGSQFQVNEYTTGVQAYSRIAARSSGEFVVVWGTEETDGDSFGIQGRSFDSAGAPISSDFQVNTYTTGLQNYPKVAVDQAGDFVVTWDSFTSAGTDTLGTSVQARSFRVSGDVGDRVWNDENYDGVQDASELGLADVEIEILDDQSQVIASAVTDAAGAYLFQKIAPGDYFLQVSPPAENWLFSPRDSGLDDTLDSDVDAAGESDVFAVESAVVLRDVDAGGRFFGVGGRVWRDLDGGGVQDGDEPSVAGVTVALFDAAGAQVAQTQTDAAGAFFIGALPGDYYLEFTAPAGDAFTLRDVGSDDLDSDVNTNGVTSVFTIEFIADFDAGLVSATATIGDRVWLDEDLDGVQDGGEPGVEGVGVELFTFAGVSQAATTTGADGSYSFSDLPEGSYYLAFAAPEGLCFTAQDQGVDDARDSDADPSTGTTGEILVASKDDVSWDAGLAPEASVGNRVWLDDGDGLQAGGEAESPA